VVAEARRHALLDPLRFKQVLSNLVSNAIKFTEQGQVSISVKLRGSGETSAQTLDVEVRDTGIGIHEQELEQLFTPFVQANPTATVPAGTGLGLVMPQPVHDDGRRTDPAEPAWRGYAGKAAHALAMRCAGQVEVPGRQQHRTPGCTAEDPVIDDHPANLLLIAQQLNYLGLRQDSAREGREGLRKWREGCFDVLIVDCNMPQMNGYELARTVRARSACTAGHAASCLATPPMPNPRYASSAWMPAWTTACSNPSACRCSASAWRPLPATPGHARKAATIAVIASICRA
jgi:two-component system sensor histidine kinase EvgS